MSRSDALPPIFPTSKDGRESSQPSPPCPRGFSSNSHGPAKSPSFRKAPPGRQDSFGLSSSRESSFSNNDGNSSMSIVFSSNWVKIKAPIGEGAFSRVFEGVYTHPETGEQLPVAVKILKKHMQARRSDCLRFIKEAKIMTKIDHRNVVACYGIGKYEEDDPAHPGCLFIVQEVVKGGNLLHKVYRQMLSPQKCVYTSSEALSWLVDVAAGMQYLHHVDEVKPLIIHRDLKLENILLCPCPGGGTVTKLVDFGLHKVIDDRIKRTVKRVVSEANIGLRSRLGVADQVAGPVDEEEDELEAALAQQRREREAVGGANEGGGEASSDNVMRSRSSPQLQSTGSSFTQKRSPLSKPSSILGGPLLETDAESGNGQQSSAVQPPSPSRASALLPPIHDSDCAAKSSDSSALTSPGGSGTSTRAPPKRTSSLQKLMNKVKDLRFRMMGTKAATVGEEMSPSNNLALEKSSVQTGSASAVQQPGVSAASGDTQDQRLTRNHQLLDQLIHQSTAARHASDMASLDDFNIPDSSADAAEGRKLRRPPRRCMTWVNEVRYNLTEAVGSWAYMAPEVVEGQPYNEKVDVFSFGVIMFEVLNRKLMLVDEIKTDPRKDAQNYALKVSRGFRPDIPKSWPSALRDLISSCWAQDPHMRPNFNAVVDMLQGIVESKVIAQLDTLFFSKGCVYV